MEHETIVRDGWTDGWRTDGGRMDGGRMDRWMQRQKVRKRLTPKPIGTPHLNRELKLKRYKHM